MKKLTSTDRKKNARQVLRQVREAAKQQLVKTPRYVEPARPTGHVPGSWDY